MFIYKLEYINTKTTNMWRHIDWFETEEALHKNMQDFLTKHNFKSYYGRQWKDDSGYTVVDFGSHIQFYRFKRIVGRIG